MAISTEERVAFLRQRLMFQGIDEEWLTVIAERMKEFERSAGELVFAEGDRGSVFYIIFKGSVRVWTIEQGEERQWEVLEAGDKFGEGALLTGNRRAASITAVGDSTFLAMHQQDFYWMLEHFPEVEEYLITLWESRQKAREMYFPWLHEGEVIHIITRRHPIRMWRELIKPIATSLLSIAIIYFGGRTNFEVVPYLIGFFILFLSIFWAIWEVVDWRNDYFILTNQRIVWLEQVVFQAAARQEAPLAAVQSVDVQTSQIGRILKYGNVLVRTYTGTGSLKLTTVDMPKY
ncbi:MAG: cyclic nucleotide-binding domain-containing protein, partial [Anaerolineales bacterium]